MKKVAILHVFFLSLSFVSLAQTGNLAITTLGVSKEYQADEKRNIQLFGNNYQYDNVIHNAMDTVVNRHSYKDAVSEKRDYVEYATGVPFTMKYIEGATFKFGYDKKDKTVEGFYMSKYEVTFDEYDAFCNATGTKKPDDEGWGRGKRPVINITVGLAEAYCDWLKDITGKPYSLPYQKYWEYAARGGQNYDKEDKIDSLGWTYNDYDKEVYEGWFSGNSNDKSHPVGELSPNGYGLYDMFGNVYEWCSDNDLEKGRGSVIRGGSFEEKWYSILELSYGGWSSSNIGFRIMRYGDD
jgi:formylglycine-generating enzyme required for sulfatase activity